MIQVPVGKSSIQLQSLPKASISVDLSFYISYIFNIHDNSQDNKKNLEVQLLDSYCNYPKVLKYWDT